MKRLILSLENENETLVDLTAEEITSFEAEKTKTLEHEAKIQVTVDKKKTDAKAGNDKLIELGLSQDQVTAMTGYTLPKEE